MSSRIQQSSGFKRQVVFRIGAEDWPLLEQAVAQFGSIQAAVLAGLRSLASPAGGEKDLPEEQVEPAAQRPARAGRPKGLPQEAEREPETNDAEEILARDAAAMLGLKSGTVRGYIRSGRLPGRYDRDPNWLGWVT